MAEFAQFEQLLRQLMSADNNSRNQAEATFNEWKKYPENIVSWLLQAARTSSDEALRSMAIILLKRVLVKQADSIWAQLSKETQQKLKAELIGALREEKGEKVKHKLSVCISALAAVLINGEGWPELLPSLFQFSQSESADLRAAGLYVFSQLAHYLGRSLAPYFGHLKTVIGAGLCDAASFKVKLNALAAAVCVLQIAHDPAEIEQFQELLPYMLEAVKSALTVNEEEEARSGIEMFIDLAELEPVFLKPYLSAIYQAMLTITTTPTLDDATRQLGLEFLVTLAESKPPMVRKFPGYIQNLLPVVLSMMADIEDEADWAVTPDEDQIDPSNNAVAEEAIDRLALALQGKTIVPVLFQLVPPLLQSGDWKQRHAALLAVSFVGEGCNMVLSPFLAQIISMVVPHVNDPHPRVRFAAASAIGQMCTDFGPDLQSLYHAQVLPGVITLLGDTATPKVQMAACNAIINFCEATDDEVLTPYMEPILAKLITVLQSPHIFVVQQAITAVAAVADCGQKKFLPFYDTFIPFLKSVLRNAVTPAHKLLRGKAIECVSFIGAAVGKEKFAQDVGEIIDLLMKYPEDAGASYTIAAWSRICGCLREDFVPYLSIVMPPLFAVASIPPDVTISEFDPSKPAQSGWEAIPIGDKQINIHTSRLEEKGTACNLILCYATELKEHFFPYVDQVAKLTVPLMKFGYHEGVRSTAVATMTPLMQCVNDYLIKTAGDRTILLNLLKFIFGTLWEAVKEENEVEILGSMLETAFECLDFVAQPCLTAEEMKNITELLVSILGGVQERRADRAETRGSDEFDDEEALKADEEEQKDQDIVADVAEIVTRLAKLHKADYLPHFQILFPKVIEFLQPAQVFTNRHAALCMLDDVVEYCGPAAVPLMQHFLVPMVNMISDANGPVRQAAVYGVGICAQFGGSAISPYIPEILNRLTAVIRSPDAQSKNYIFPTENAISSIGKIARYQPQAANNAQLLPLWLTMLPVTKDNVESKLTYDNLCYFVESNNMDLLGPGYQNLPKILQIFGAILETDLIDASLTQRIVTILKRMQGALPADVLQSVWASLGDDQKQKLQRAVASQ